MKLEMKIIIVVAIAILVLISLSPLLMVVWLCFGWKLSVMWASILVLQVVRDLLQKKEDVKKECEK
jgi:hypothetical protein